MSFPLYLIPLYSYKPGHATTAFFGSKKRTPTKFAPPWSQVAGTQQPGLNPLPRPLEHESLQDASPWVEQTWLRTPGKHLGWGKGIGDDSKESVKTAPHHHPHHHPSILVIIVVSIFVPLWALNQKFQTEIQDVQLTSDKSSNSVPADIRMILQEDYEKALLPHGLRTEPLDWVWCGQVRFFSHVLTSQSVYTQRMTCHPVLNNALILFQAWLQIQLPSSRIRFWRKHVNI